MKKFPLFVDLDNQRCLIVGGGHVAYRRARQLINAGAVVDLVATDIDPSLQQLINESGGQVIMGPWHLNQLSPDSDYRYRLVVAATDDPAVNGEVVEQARKIGVLANASSKLPDSDFDFASVIDRDPLTIAVSSGSASPLLARLLLQRINSLVPRGYGRLAELVRDYRDRVKERIGEPKAISRFWQNVLTGGVAEQVFSGNTDRAKSRLDRMLDQYRESPDHRDHGEVYLVGAGPGDPELLTFRAYRLLQQSEVVLYDRLVSDRILELIPAQAEKIYVGKRRDHHSIPQTAINQQLLTLARSGKRVTRLKGGDPFIFGRGGEEISLLAEHKIPFQVVPGITAASGCAAYSGIPLTHRDHAQSVRFVTGQLKDGGVALPWQQLVAPDQTLVIYMGLQGLPIIAESLIANGLAADTPAALIEQGTTPDQKIHCSTLAQLPEQVRDSGVKAPTLLIIGSVVNLHHSLDWFVPCNAEPAEPADPAV